MVYPVANEQTLRDPVAEYKAQGEAYQQKIQEVIRSSVAHKNRLDLPMGNMIGRFMLPVTNHVTHQ